MDKEIKVDKQYLKSFNLGYEVAKELNLKSPMFKNFESNSTGRMSALQDGMAQYISEVTVQKNKNNSKTSILKKDIQKKNKGKGFNLSN